MLKALAFVLLLVKIWKIFKITQKQKDNAPPNYRRELSISVLLSDSRRLRVTE